MLSVVVIAISLLSLFFLFQAQYCLFAELGVASCFVPAIFEAHVVAALATTLFCFAVFLVDADVRIFVRSGFVLFAWLCAFGRVRFVSLGLRGCGLVFPLSFGGFLFQTNQVRVDVVLVPF